MKEIDWAEWENDIHTPGVVSKIKAKYDSFMETEYAIDDGAAKVFSKTEKFHHLEYAVEYNYYLWMNHYVGHLNQLENMRNLGDVTSLSSKSSCLTCSP